MPDISMCKGTNCKRRFECYRYTADANPYRQSYFGVVPVRVVKGGQVCDYFYPNQLDLILKSK